MEYKFIKQKSYCCVPACISMILDRRKIKHNSQEKIGYELGLIVPKEAKKYFNKVRTGKKPIAGWGTQVRKKKYSLTNFFKKHKIKLKEKYYNIEKIGNAKKFIKNNLKKNNDIIACFNYKKLYGKGNDGGHASLVQNLNKENVILIDPCNKKVKVKLSKLINSMKHHGKKRRAGFWLISNK